MTLASRSNAEALRDGLRSLPSLAAHATGQSVSPSQIFFPLSHADALNPQATLVVGNRGMGKSFWASALMSPEAREIIAGAYADFTPRQMAGLEVYFGFADAEGGHGAVSKEQIALAAKVVSPETLWRAVLIRQLAPKVGVSVPRSFADLAKWVRDNVEDQQEILRRVDHQLASEGKTALFLFDQLDQLADGWAEIQRLTQGLLKVSLALKSYRALRAKIFMRPDQAENRDLFRFPDASKIYGGRVRLRWRAVELYGLLFFELLRHDISKAAFEDLCRQCGVDLGVKHRRMKIPVKLAWDPFVQHKVFDGIAGAYMGKSYKRGLPYTWIPVHLADAIGEVSPRTFLRAIKVAAEHIPPPADTPIDYEGLLEGVREASENRLSELQEDYPWVSDALEPLRGILVPCEIGEIVDRWNVERTTDNILSKYRNTSAPIGMTSTADLFGEADAAQNLLESLVEIGVLEPRTNGKINVPDIFRIKAGILRKGGVTPQQRQRL